MAGRMAGERNRTVHWVNIHRMVKRRVHGQQGAQVLLGVTITQVGTVWGGWGGGYTQRDQHQTLVGLLRGSSAQTGNRATQGGSMDVMVGGAALAGKA